MTTAIRPKSLLLVAAGAAVALALGGCTPSRPGSSVTDAGLVKVVASTDVWGDLAATIGGADVRVTSIIDDPDRDPHEYEANAQNQLAISKAAIVIVNGGGYDDFVDEMLASAGSQAVVLDAVDISGFAAAQGDGLNEHVWYDFPTVEKVVDAIESALVAADPADAATFHANAIALNGGLDGLIAEEARLKAQYAGEGASITEPVPRYLLDAIGLVDKTPSEFSEAIEEDTDVSPAVLEETLALYRDHAVRLLVYNEQTAGAETQAVLDAAQQAGIPAVPVTETLPAGEDYLDWMTDNLDAVAGALGR